MADEEAVLEKDGASPESEVEQAGPEAGRTEDQPEPDAPEPEKESGEEEPEQKKREGGYKRKARRYQAEAEYWRAKALESPKPEPKPAEADDPEPKFEDYEDKPIAEYNRAWSAWTRRQAVKDATAAVEKQQRARSQESEYETQRQAFFKREDAVAEQHADYEDLASAASEMLSESKSPSAAHIGQALIVSDQGPELLYHLGKNPDEIQRLVKLPPTVALLELGKLEARLAQEPREEPEKPPEPRISKAPPPPTPIRKASRVHDGELRDDLEPSEWMRRYLKKLEKKQNG